MQDCQCEHFSHPDEGCGVLARREVKTDGGTFWLCDPCIEKRHGLIFSADYDGSNPEVHS